MCEILLTIGLRRWSIKADMLQVGELIWETIGLMEIGVLWSFLRKFKVNGWLVVCCGALGCVNSRMQEGFNAHVE